jgi:hypothetical protein
MAPGESRAEISQIRITCPLWRGGVDSLGTDSTDRRGNYYRINPSEIRAKQYPVAKIRVNELQAILKSTHRIECGIRMVKNDRHLTTWWNFVGVNFESYCFIRTKFRYQPAPKPALIKLVLGQSNSEQSSPSAKVRVARDAKKLGLSPEPLCQQRETGAAIRCWLGASHASQDLPAEIVDGVFDAIRGQSPFG